MTKEEYKKNLIRYFNSLRDNRKSVMIFCDDIICSECMFRELCRDFDKPGMQPHQMFKSSFEVIELLEKWAKEHPPITNKDKIEQVFGVEIDPKHGCPPGVGRCEGSNCDECRKWWGEEYKGPNEEEAE
jgi:hypothetical protein